MTEGSIERDGVRIAYEEQGEGPPIVLLHSFLCDRHMWRAQAAALADGHRVVNIDMRGHGQSGPARPGIELDDLVEDVLAVLDALGVGSAVWAGLSIGGMLALRGALRAPERARALILLDTDAGSETLLRRLRYRAMGVAARLLGMRPLLGPVSRLMFGGTTRGSAAELVADWQRRFAEVDAQSVLAILKPLVRRESLMREVADIAVPCLVLVGSEDTSLPPARSEQLARSLRHARFRTIPHAGHLSAVEQPEAVTREMVAFLDELPRLSPRARPG